MATTIILKTDDLRSELQHYAKRFRPAHHCAPVFDYSDATRVDEPLDLASLAEDTILAVKGYHRAADYILRVSDGRITVWRDPDQEGLEASVDDIVSVYRTGDLCIKPGVIIPDRSVAMPFFDYKCGRALLPKSMWIDAARVWRYER